jgi:hypothetical protein
LAKRFLAIILVIDVQAARCRDQPLAGAALAGARGRHNNRAPTPYLPDLARELVHIVGRALEVAIELFGDVEAELPEFFGNQMRVLAGIVEHRKLHPA